LIRSWRTLGLTDGSLSRTVAACWVVAPSRNSLSSRVMARSLAMVWCALIWQLQLSMKIFLTREQRSWTTSLRIAFSVRVGAMLSSVLKICGSVAKRLRQLIVMVELLGG